MSRSPEESFPRLANYEILEVIGEGGMGTVYLADDLRHDRKVAIKTIRQDFVTPDLARRFEREIKLTGGLQHPRILPLLDSGVADGTLYYVMQFVEGESLAERLGREGALPIDEALRIARHVADALHSAHAKGIVHRDIKPANVMLSGGHALVMDFGIARALAEGSTSLTSTGSAIGTPTYMSPEQIADATGVDGRSDIYSLGCVLYEMVAGHPPFTGATVDSILRQHMTADPPSLIVHRPGTPPEVDATVRRAMQKSPADRFQTARELVEELHEISGGSGLLADPASRRRTAFIVIAAYLAGAWGVLEIVERVAETASLPGWTVPFALVLLLIGLLVVAATAVIQTTGAGKATSRVTDPGTGGARARRGPADGAKGLDALFRWRNVVAGGVLALLLWGVVAVASLMRRSVDVGVEGVDAEPTAGDPLPTDPGTAGGGEDPEAAPGRDDDAATGAESESGQPSGVADADRDVIGPERTEGPTRGAEPDAARADRAEATSAVARARQEAESARNEAEAVGAREAPTPVLARADSLWSVGVQGQAAGRLSDAAAAFEAARIAYGSAGVGARGILAQRVDSARRELDSLRGRADPASPHYTEAERLQEEGDEAEEGEDLPAALDALQQASRAYARAIPDPAIPPSDSTGGPEDAAPAAPSPSERISSAMSALERALEAEDVSAIRRIWVNLGSEQVEGFRAFFATGRDLEYRYEIDPGSVRVAGGGIEFRVTAQWEYTDARGDRVRVEPFEQRFRLERSGDGDVLTSLPDAG